MITKGQLERHVEFAGLIYKVLLQTRQLVAPGPNKRKNNYKC